MKVLKTHEFARSAVGGRTHDWDILLDGQIRQLDSGDIGDSKPSTFVSQARTQATKRGMGLKTQIEGDAEQKGGDTTVTIQAVVLTEDELAERKARGDKLRAARAAKKAAGDQSPDADGEDQDEPEDTVSTPSTPAAKKGRGKK